MTTCWSLQEISRNNLQCLERHNLCTAKKLTKTFLKTLINIFSSNPLESLFMHIKLLIFRNCFFQNRKTTRHFSFMKNLSSSYWTETVMIKKCPYECRQQCEIITHFQWDFEDFFWAHYEENLGLMRAINFIKSSSSLNWT